MRLTHFDPINDDKDDNGLACSAATVHNELSLAHNYEFKEHITWKPKHIFNTFMNCKYLGEHGIRV